MLMYQYVAILLASAFWCSFIQRSCTMYLRSSVHVSRLRIFLTFIGAVQEHGQGQGPRSRLLVSVLLCRYVDVCASAQATVCKCVLNLEHNFSRTLKYVFLNFHCCQTKWLSLLMPRYRNSSIFKNNWYRAINDNNPEFHFLLFSKPLCCVSLLIIQRALV